MEVQPNWACDIVHDDQSVAVSVANVAPYGRYVSENPVCFTGVTVSILKAVSTTESKRLTFHAASHPPQRVVIDNATYDGAPADVLKNLASISACPIAISDTRLGHFDPIPGYVTRDYYIAAQRSELHLSKYTSILAGLVQSFDLDTWIALAGLILSILTILWLIKIIELFGCFAVRGRTSLPKHPLRLVLIFIGVTWDTFQNLLGHGKTKHLRNVRMRNVLVLVWLPWSTFIAPILTSYLTSNFAERPRPLMFGTFNRFLASDFRLLVRKGSSYSQYLSSRQTAASTIEVIDTGSSNTLYFTSAAQRSQREKIAAVCNTDETMECESNGFIKAAPLELRNWISLVQTRKNSSLTKQLHIKVLTLSQAGITRYWINIHRLLHSANSPLYRQQTMEHNHVITMSKVTGVLQLCFFLLGVSVMCFCYESSQLLYFQLKKMLKPVHGSLTRTH